VYPSRSASPRSSRDQQWTVAIPLVTAAVLPNGDVLVFGDDNLQLGPDAVPTVKTPTAEVSR
jgi:hypothetical protein